MLGAPGATLGAVTDSHDDSSDSSGSPSPSEPSALRREGSQALSTATRGQGNVGMYAAAAGVLSALPIPFVDSLLASLARGAAMRRVAQRHGVRLEPAARALLARGDDGLRTEKGLRIVRSVVGRFVAPLRVVNRVEEALSAVSAAALLDHYLTTADRRPGAPLTEDEARRIQQAMKGAAGKGAVDALRGVPLSALAACKGAVDAVRGSDAEGRPTIECLVDALLDALADAPDGLSDAIRNRFDDALSRGDGAARGAQA